MPDLVIKNGILVTPDQIFRGDILVRGDKIVTVAPEIVDPAAEVIEAEGLHIFPGAIDAHVHLRDPGATQKEDFTTGTRAALAGGVTTVLDMPNNPQPTVSSKALEDKRAIATQKAVCDFGLFIGATGDNYPIVGSTSAIGVKVYLGATTGDLLVTDFPSVYHHFAAPHRLPIVVHAEDNEALRFFSSAKTTSRHSEKRPPVAASVAVARAIALAEASGRQLHIAHLSTAAELAQVESAKERGVSMTFEAAPQHLFLSTDDEERLGPFGVVNPPLRSPENVRSLWSHLASWDIVATDHAPHTRNEKLESKPSGMPGLETMLPLLLNAAFNRRLSLNDIARLTSRNPARIFHLEHKGEIAAGYDADLTFVRLDEEHSLRSPWQTRCGWSAFEGLRVRGRVVRVLLRGQLAMDHGEILLQPGAGRPVNRGQI